MAIRHLQQELPGIDLFSREFLFDRKHAQARSQLLIIAGPYGLRTRLSFLLREALPDGYREKIFPGDYDLGNQFSLLPRFCAIDDRQGGERASLAEELSQDLWREGKSESLSEENFKKLKRDLTALTGRSMQQHYACNKSTALKVMKLLYRFGRDRWSSESGEAGKGEAKSQLFDLLKWPEGEGRHRFSLSFRGTYPYQSASPKSPFKASDDQSVLIADLKAYLSIELDDKTYEDISAVPAMLQWHINNIVHNVEKLLVDTGRKSYLDAVKLYDYLAEKVGLLKFKILVAEIGLDEELFLYLHTLEFAHFMEAYPKLLEKAEPTRALLPVFPAIEMLAKDSTGDAAIGMHDPIIADDRFFDFIRDWMGVLVLIVGKALGEKTTHTELEKAVEPAYRLATTYALFRKRPNGDDLDDCFSALELIASLCCVRDEQAKKENERTRHKPYWKGQQAQGGSILTSLKAVPQDDDKFLFDDPVPEEHRLIWTSRFEWFLDALQGHTELTVQRFRLRSALAFNVKEIIKTNNRAGMAEDLEKLSEATCMLGLNFLIGEDSGAVVVDSSV